MRELEAQFQEHQRGAMHAGQQSEGGRDEFAGISFGTLLMISIAAVAAFTFWHLRRHDSSRPPPRFATVAEAQREAVRRYPALGIAGTTLNREFVARHRLYQEQRPEFLKNPDWPVLLADEVIGSFGSKPVEKAPVRNPAADGLKEQFAVLLKSYPKVDARKNPLSPADSVWLFRSEMAGAGTVEVGFQGADVVYMLFRRGVGGKTWTNSEIHQLHRAYSEPLLHDDALTTRYRSTVIPRINAAAITRPDFDPQRLASGS